MAIDISKDLEQEIQRGVSEGPYASPEEFLRESLKWADAYRRMLRKAITDGAAEADRGELIPGDEVFAEIDIMLADMRKAAREA